MNSLRISGYDQKFRYELLKGIQAREAQIEQDINWIDKDFVKIFFRFLHE